MTEKEETGPHTDEQIEKLISLAGNRHFYQYFTLFVITFLWLHCNILAIIIPYIEREPIITYCDEKNKFHSDEMLTNDICDNYTETSGNIGKYQYNITERFDYSWVSEFDIECDKKWISLTGTFVFVGNTMGAIVFTLINGFMTHKLILIISSFGFCISLFLNTLVRSFDYYPCSLVCLVFIGMFGNCLCYSSLVLIEEVVAHDIRSIFSGVINVGYSLSGVVYSILFWLTQDWRIIYYICIGGSFISLILIWIFIYNSPRSYINKKDYKNTIKILEGIASFNGKLKEFKEGLNKEEFQDIIGAIKGENDEPVEIEIIKLKNNIGDDAEENGVHQEMYGNENQEDIKNKENEEIKNNDNIEVKDNENQENNDDGNENLNIYRETNKYRDTNENINRASDRDTNQNSNKDSTVDPNKEKKEPLIQRNSSSYYSGRKSKIQNTINIWSLCKYPSIRYKFIILNILWIGTRICFNGIAISSKSFKGNFYINIIVLSIIEAFSNFLPGFVINVKWIGRKGALWIQYLIIVITLLVHQFFDLSLVPELICNYIARFCSSGIEVIYYTYSIECYPTLVRSMAFGINLFFGNGGAIIAPTIIEYLDKWYKILFSFMYIINSILIFFLPETCGKPMVETIAELGE